MTHTDAAAGQTIGQVLGRAAAHYGDREAYTFADRRLSFRDVDVESDAVARAFLAFGVKRGDRVAVMLANHSPWPALFFGAIKIGVSVVTLNTRLRPDEIVYALAHSGASILIFMREVKGRTDYGEIVLEVLPELHECRPGALRTQRVPALHTVVDLADPPLTGTMSFGEFLERGRTLAAPGLAAAARAVGPRDEAVIVFTSGTTALPKGTRLHHQGMLHSMYSFTDRVALTKRDVYLTMQPYYHSGGAIGGMLPPIISGCRLVNQAYFDPGDALDAMEAEGVTFMVAHQPHYVEYMNHPTMPSRRLSLERAIVLAPPEFFWLVREKFGIDGLVSSYSATETHLYGTGTSLSDPIEVRFNTNGRPMDGVRLEIRDPDDGTLLGPDEPGEIFLHVPYPMLGYIGDPRLTSDVLGADGWYRTGDKGVIHTDGNLCLLGRVRDMIRVGGENLSGAEVEAVLLVHPAVKQAAAVAAPDHRLGEVVVAFVELKDGAGATGPELIDYCRVKLAGFKVPRVVHFVSEWPMTGSGKVQRNQLLQTVSREAS
jgi:fatty-acyl-CoA synthase